MSLPFSGYVSTCKYIEVSNTQFQHEVVGRYALLPKTMMCNGRQTYQKVGDEEFIYYLDTDDGFRGWMIGTHFCKNEVIIQNCFFLTFLLNDMNYIISNTNYARYV